MTDPTNLQGTSPPSSPGLRLTWPDRIFLILLLLISANYYLGLRAVPFHPDESTNTFMSSDVELFYTQPSQLYWSTAPSDVLRQHYRELDAPLTRTLIGIGRWIDRQPPTPADWDWSKSWVANAAAGAVPPDGLLFTARMAVAWLFPISLALVYLGCRKAGHAWAGLIACAALGINPLVLLHTRRAMAESGLFFGSAFIFFCLSSPKIRPWIAGLAAAIAVNAKQSAAGLVPALLVAFSWPWSNIQINVRRILLCLGELLLPLAVLTIVLNPFLWGSPISAARAALADRKSLLTLQSSDYSSQMPQSANPVLTQAVVILAQVYLAPPQFEENGNYSQNIDLEKLIYLENPLNDFIGGLIWGGLFLFFTLAGMLLPILRFRKLRAADRRWLAYLFIATICEFLILCIALPLPFQRYVIPLLPYLAVWAGLGLEQIVEPIRFRRRKNKATC
jgi:4-amino-4-deoxy-L-arabinose transferase-like glycosyltransferase